MTILKVLSWVVLLGSLGWLVAEANPPKHQILHIHTLEETHDDFSRKAADHEKKYHDHLEESAAAKMEGDSQRALAHSAKATTHNVKASAYRKAAARLAK